MELTQINSGVKLIRWSFAQTHPVLAYLLIAFGWSWLFWLGIVPFRGQNDLLVMAMVLLGGYGPAIGCILTLGLRKGMTLDLSPKKMTSLLIAALVIFTVMATRYLVGNVPGYVSLPDNLTITPIIIVTAVTASLVGGWVISNAFSQHTDIREKMASVLPIHLPSGWTVFALLFFPGMILASWGIAALLGTPVDYPSGWGLSALELIPLFLLSFTLTGLAQGGMEEPGWRGLLQPTLQERFSPLTAALFVSLIWSLWHLPLYLNGFYEGDLVGGMIGSAIYRIFLAIFLAWFYNRSGGNLFLIVFLHTCFNVMVDFMPLSDFVMLVLWVLVVAVIVIKDK
ncbi:MAG: CPBP family intramembrane glutamic endopeptidase, partial [Anaerolineales bacterium]